jgi:hypothetical protein
MENSINRIYGIMRESTDASDYEWEGAVETVKSEISRILTTYQTDRDYSKAYRDLSELTGRYTGNIDVLQEASGPTEDDLVKFLNSLVA